MLTALLDQRRAAGAWLLGGLPLVASSLQAISALLGNNNIYWIPLLGGMAESLTSLSVVQEAAVIFYSQTSVVLTLFLLIAASWLAQFFLMFSKRGRETSYSKTGSAGAVVLSGILYAFLFLGMYSPLFSRGVGPVQIAGFFLIPVFATGSLGAAYRVYSWKGQRRAESIARIKSAERTAKTEKRHLERVLDELPLGKVETISPEAVRDVTEVKEGLFEDRDSIIEGAESALRRSSQMPVSKLEKESYALKEQANALDTDRARDELESMLRSALDDVVDERFRDVRSEFRSGYGERYQTANLPEELRSVEVPGADEQIVISTASRGGVSEQLHNVIANDEISLAESIDLLDRVDSKIHDDVLPHLREYEQQVQHIESTVEENLDNASGKIDDVGGHTRRALERIFVSGTTGDDIDSAVDVRDRLDEARDELHACELADAIADCETAREMTEEYLETIRFVRGAMIPGIERDKTSVSSVPHPDSRDHDFLTASLIERLHEPIRNDYGAAIELDLDAQEISIDHDVDPSETGEVVSKQSTETGPRDEVKYLIREIRSDAGDGDVPSETTVSLDALPDPVRKADPGPEFVEFVESVDDLAITEYPPGTEDDGERASDGNGRPSGYISIKSTGGEPIERATDGLVDEYRSWANGTRAHRT